MTEQLNVAIMKNVPFDDENTMYFTDANSQYTTIQNLPGTLAFRDLQAVRVSENKIRVSYYAQSLINQGFNYIAFRDKNYVDYGNNMIYAFIEDISYISDTCAEITFRIDVMQTYFLFHTSEKMGYVERCHSKTDEIGDNITPETFSVGDLVCNTGDLLAIDEFTNPSEWMVVIGVTNKTFENSDYCGFYDGFLNGIKLYAFQNNTIKLESISYFLQDYQGKEDAVKFMYMCPSKFLPSDIKPDGEVPESQYVSAPIEIEPHLKISKRTTLDGYTPRNAKLYTYPYNLVRLETSDGRCAELRYEFFENLTPMFYETSSFVYPPSVTVTPVNYGGLTTGSSPSNTAMNLPYQVTLSGFPEVGWRYSNFDSYLAQQAIALPLNLLTSVVQGASVGGKAGAVAGLATGLLSGVVSAVPQYLFDSGTVKGSSGSANNLSKGNGFGIYATRYSVPAKTARVIDDYFTRYGYKQDRYMEIPLKNRTNFTYVKCHSVDINPACPKKYADEIREKLKNGITFWTNFQTFGDAMYVLNDTL